MAMTESARAALRALCQRIVPAAFDANNPAAGSALLARVEARIASLPPARACETELFLSFVPRRFAGMLLSGRPIVFTNAAENAQDRFLAAWQAHPFVRIRGAFQGLRKLILWTWWETAGPRASIGWLGPLHLRDPVLAWEGPLSGVARSEEPVFRSSESRPGENEPALHPVHAQRPHQTGPSVDLVANGAVLRADVCVVGSGAGGSVAAARLASAGLDVIVLEEGRSWRPADSDEEESTMVHRLYAEGGTRATDDQSITLFQGACLGGGTTVNWMLMLRPPLHVMEEWQNAWRAELLGPAALLPALERIEADVSAARVPPDAHSAQNRALLDGAVNLGWAVEESRINAKGCVRAGTCGLGCHWGAKQSATETFLPVAQQHGARVLCQAHVERIEAPAGRGAMRRVHVRGVVDGAGAAGFVIEAATVVLAAGAVGTPAILQRSGLGGGGVGRFLRLHPTTAVVGLYDHDMYGGAGIPQSSVCTEFLNRAEGFGFWIECPPFQPALAAAALPGYGHLHAERMRDYRRLGAFIVLVRDGAPPDRDRSQGSVRARRSGRVSIRYALRGRDWDHLAHGIAACARLHLAAGARSALGLFNGARAVTSEAGARDLAHRRYQRNRISLFSAHVNGTCRMGTDPGSSGCDPEGRRHGVERVYIADGSIFPSAPAANPQATIMAAASLIADRIVQR
jgi:choline dehydrogenase-like flavoprotein